MNETKQTSGITVQTLSKADVKPDKPVENTDKTA